MIFDLVSWSTLGKSSRCPSCSAARQRQSQSILGITLAMKSWLNSTSLTFSEKFETTNQKSSLKLRARKPWHLWPEWRGGSQWWPPSCTSRSTCCASTTSWSFSLQLEIFRKISNHSCEIVATRQHKNAISLAFWPALPSRSAIPPEKGAICPSSNSNPFNRFSYLVSCHNVNELYLHLQFN